MALKQYYWGVWTSKSKIRDRKMYGNYAVAEEVKPFANWFNVGIFEWEEVQILESLLQLYCMAYGIPDKYEEPPVRREIGLELVRRLRQVQSW